jgi:hypothetical protein
MCPDTKSNKLKLFGIAIFIIAYITAMIIITIVNVGK